MHPTGRETMPTLQRRLQEGHEDMPPHHQHMGGWCRKPSAWRLLVRQGTKRSEKERKEAATEKRARRKERQQHLQQASPFVCSHCTRDYHSKIGLFSNLRSCRFKKGDTTPSSLVDERMPIIFLVMYRNYLI